MQSNKIQGQVPLFSIKYGTGEIRGEFVSDEVSIGDLKVKNQTFGLTYREKGYAFMNVSM